MALSPNLLDLTAKHYLVTGAASGIGFAISRLFGQLGAKISMIDLDGPKLDDAGNRLSAAEHAKFVFDLENVEGIDQLVRDIVSANGPLHGMIHAAGTQTVMPARDVKAATWRRILAVNCEAALALSKNMGRKNVYAGSAGAV